MSASMRTGRLRHVGTLQRKTETENKTGELVATWADVAEGVRCSVSPIRGREGVYAGRIRETTTHKIRMRWVSGLNPTDRLVVDGTTYEFEEVLNFENLDVYADIMAKEIR